MWALLARLGRGNATKCAMTTVSSKDGVKPRLASSRGKGKNSNKYIKAPSPSP